MPSKGSGSHCQVIHGQMSRSGERIGRLCPELGRMRCRRLRVSNTDPRRPQGDLRTTNRQDSIDAAVMAGPSISRIKKSIFSPPSKCPIDLFGPVANGTILIQLHVASRSSSPSRADSDRGRPGFRGPRPSYPLLDAVDATDILTVALPESSARPRPGRCGSWMRTPVDAGFFWISAVS